MANYYLDIDSVLHIYATASEDIVVGVSSDYSTAEHPGTNKKIEGWKWDRAVWPNEKQVAALSYAPTIWDPVASNLADEYWQSGIGSDDDLKVIGFDEEEEKWLPEVHPGYFYIHENEHYLFGDDFRTQFFFCNQLTSGVQRIDLETYPKPGMPIRVRSYTYDPTNPQYLINIELRKKDHFTGILFSGEPEDTENDDGTIAYHLIDHDKFEFVVDYDADPYPKIYLNDDYSEEIAASGETGSYEFLGVSDGWKRQYHTRYSPIDPSGVFHLITVISSGSYEEWKQINSTSDFSTELLASGGEYRLDKALGIVEFGNISYEDPTASGLNGKIPSKGTQIYATYTKGMMAEYEPEYARDLVVAEDADLYSLNNVYDHGFITIDPRFEEPASLVLTSTLSGLNYNYYAEVGDPATRLTATLTSNLGDLMPNRGVVFELTTDYGTFSDGSTRVVTRTNSDGEATAWYTPPATLDNIRKVTNDVQVSGDFVIVRVRDIAAPASVNDVATYAVQRTDSVLGMPSSGINPAIATYLDDEEIEVDPAGWSSVGSGITFEKKYRQTFGLTDYNEYDDTQPSTLGQGRYEIVYTTRNTIATDPHTGDQSDSTRFAFSGIYTPARPISFRELSTDYYEFLYSGLEWVTWMDVYNVGGERIDYKKVPVIWTSGIFYEQKALALVVEPHDIIRSYAQSSNTYDNNFIDSGLATDKLYSNSIQVNFDISEQGEGVLDVSSPSEVPSGLLRESKVYDYYWTSTDYDLIEAYPGVYRIQITESTTFSGQNQTAIPDSVYQTFSGQLTDRYLNDRYFAQYRTHDVIIPTGISNDYVAYNFNVDSYGTPIEHIYTSYVPPRVYLEFPIYDQGPNKFTISPWIRQLTNESSSIAENQLSYNSVNAIPYAGNSSLNIPGIEVNINPHEGIDEWLPFDCATVAVSFRNKSDSTFNSYVSFVETEGVDGKNSYIYLELRAGDKQITTNYWLGDAWNHKLTISASGDNNVFDGNWHRIYWRYNRWDIGTGQFNSDGDRITQAVWLDGRLIGSGDLAVSYTFPERVSYTGGSMFTLRDATFDEFYIVAGLSYDNIEPSGNLSYYAHEYEPFDVWFKRSMRGDSQTWGMKSIAFSGDCPTIIPVGYRFKTSDCDNASMLDRNTFFDLAPIPKRYSSTPYFDFDYNFNYFSPDITWID